MDLIERLVDRMVSSQVPLERGPLEAAVAAALLEEAPLAPAGTVEEVVDALVGLGPVERLLRDPAVSDVLVNGDGSVWIERSGELQRTEVRFDGSDAVVAAVERALTPLGLRIDRASPIVDARLPDGSRLHAVIPPVSVDGPVMAVRRFTAAVPDLPALVSAGGIDQEGADLLAAAVAARESIVVSGGTGAGKTTLLNILSTAIPGGERIVVVEDTAELRLAGHVVRLEARPANAEGAGAVTLQHLVRAALRLRPDRIVLGEVRGPEALDLIAAMNTGHDGSLSTVHANSADEALWRLETLAMSGERRAGERSIRGQLRAGIRLIVQMARRNGRRQVVEVAHVGQPGCEVVHQW